jgi:hypothetical protein
MYSSRVIKAENSLQFCFHRVCQSYERIIIYLSEKEWDECQNS